MGLWLTAASFALYFIRLPALTAWRGNFGSINNYTGETFWNVTLKQFHMLCLTLISQLIAIVVSDSLWPHGLQHARPPCPPPTPTACSNSSPLSRCCHPIVSFSIVPISSCLQSFPASGSFPTGQFFDSGGQSTGASASASVLLINIQDWFPLGLTGLILQSKGLSRVFSNTTVQKHEFFGTQPS